MCRLFMSAAAEILAAAATIWQGKLQSTSAQPLGVLFYNMQHEAATADDRSSLGQLQGALAAACPHLQHKRLPQLRGGEENFCRHPFRRRRQGKLQSTSAQPLGMLFYNMQHEVATADDRSSLGQLQDALAAACPQLQHKRLPQLRGGEEDFRF